MAALVLTLFSQETLSPTERLITFSGGLAATLLGMSLGCISLPCTPLTWYCSRLLVRLGRVLAARLRRANATIMAAKAATPARGTVAAQARAPSECRARERESRTEH